MPQGVYDALCYAVGGFQKLLVDAHKVINNILSFTNGHSKRDEPGRLRPSSPHPVSCGSRQSQARAASDSGRVSMSNTFRSSVLASSGATDHFDCSARC